MSYITHETISIEAFLKDEPDGSCGASVHFIGTVRNHQGGRFVVRLNYECYEVLANKEIARIAREVQEKYHCAPVRIIHRVGMLDAGEIAVAIYVNSVHRNEAFRACRETIERIKQTVPIWKQEFYQDGTSEWMLCGHPHEICHDF